ncbi:flagellar export chaperone FliS [Paenibacillus sp. TRM 82003]|uniref:flagellar export chaperone FliS n=1 Tax=Kineococcus sp. TRM81007 TaxID=2925831 RepID=UPI001F5A31BC|nr:flagellar export chaperone FliS [Kineococcus sp. TRM81007]MCI2240628.1 flagellar export chaperone FliS [Kineococcus sp. TRM81007]MCI3925450.1 flagellar export chaperone FliS [Paenibacillus sp. TRM 82003]
MTSTTYGRRATANRYLADSLSTASPATLLVMLYDRLVLDLQRAEQAQRDGDRETAHVNLVHAQDIVRELLSSLDVQKWDGGPGLQALYTWLIQELAVANVSGDPERTAACRTTTVEPLAEAWRQAALEHLSSTPATGHGIA